MNSSAAAQADRLENHCESLKWTAVDQLPPGGTFFTVPLLPLRLERRRYPSSLRTLDRASSALAIDPLRDGLGAGFFFPMTKNSSSESSSSLSTAWSPS
jgi:hypothetical protein